MKSEKITKRWYDDACGTAHAMELLGERWALLVMRELMFGPRRFGELRASLPGISANVLTQRLTGLEQAGIVRRHRLPPPASATVYGLTSWGLEAEPLVQGLGRWAARSPAHDPTLPLSPASAMMSLRTMIDPVRAGDIAGRFAFRFGEEAFLARLADGALAVERGEGEADVRYHGAPEALAAIVYLKLPVEAFDGAAVEGDRDLFARFVDLYHLPPKAAVE